MMHPFENAEVATRTDQQEYVDFFPAGYRIGRTKYIFVTGGVMSGVGKGVFTASLACLLQHWGLSVTCIKIDGYLNYDAGTLNPYRHGETFVLGDGTECDMDLGTYERFLDQDLDSTNYITSGKVYSLILAKERRGDYLGRDVLVIPHVTGEIKQMIREKARTGGYDVVLVEIGGTVGDIENLHFVEAARELMHDEGRDNVMFCHLTMVPYNEAAGEQKSKPTQHSVKKLLEMGVQPDMVVCRSQTALQDKIRQKISLYCNIAETAVVSSPQIDCIYKLPAVLHSQQVARLAAKRLAISLPHLAKARIRPPMGLYINHDARLAEPLRLAMAGKYASMRDTYVSITNALVHLEPAENVRFEVSFIDTTAYDDPNTPLPAEVDKYDGVIIPGGYGTRGTEGMIRFIRHAREKSIPMLGLCFGFQLAAIELARNVCGLEGADSTEFAEDTPHPVICLLPEQEGKETFGGTQRLGDHEVKLVPDTKAAELYGKTSPKERFRHRWEFNPEYRETFEEHGVRFSGTTPDGRIMQILELDDHPFFIATQFHPEWHSRPLAPHPLWRGFVRECREQKHRRESAASAAAAAAAEPAAA